ncbi:hypothetical protein SUGI_0207030 [Cryptomeria japonica]|nr:hypothetical protein SUGI_0207030 [Cryptomeria japonica]
MCISILPDLNNAGSSFSKWLVVKTNILSLPQHDHSPSVKFSNPERVIALLLSSVLSTGDSDLLSTFQGFLALSERLREQSISSITMIDLLVVLISSFLSHAFVRDSVSSMS